MKKACISALVIILDFLCKNDNWASAAKSLYRAAYVIIHSFLRTNCLKPYQSASMRVCALLDSVIRMEELL